MGFINIVVLIYICFDPVPHLNTGNVVRQGPPLHLEAASKLKYLTSN